MKKPIQVCLTACISAFVSANALAIEGIWRVRSESEYSSGFYGGDIKTKTLYVPLEIRRMFEWGEIGVSIPYLWYESEGIFSYIDPAASPQLQTIPISESAEGMADLLFDVIYRIVPQSGNRPDVVLRGYWKPPTANENKGLGTGGHDILLGTEFWGWMPNSERWFYFGNVYAFFSDGAPDREDHDSWIYEAGLGGLITSKLLAKVSYKEHTPITPGRPPSTLAVLETEYKVNPNFKILSGFSYGLSDAAPDWRVMLGFDYSF